MAVISKKQMSEEDIKLNFITPAIQPGWGGHITMETKITDGRINIKGNMVARSKPKFADYMLYLNDGKPIVNGKYFPANSAINFQQISAVKNQQFIMPHISRGVSPGSVIYSNGRLTS